MPVDYIDKIEDGQMIENVETRYLENVSNKWRSRETPARFLGLDNESQELFDSGYIGDDGIDNEDMRIKVYNGSLFIENSINEVIEQNDEEERHRRLVDIFSVGSINIKAKDDINIDSGKGYSINVNSGKHYNKKVFHNDETVVGHDKIVTVLYNNKNDIRNDYILNVGQNYISSIGNIEQHNSRDSTFNNNNNFSVNAENIVNIVANNQMALTSNNFMRVESKDRMVIRSAELLEEIERNIDRICENMSYNINSTYDVTAKNIVNVATEDYKIVTKDFTNMINGLYTLKVRGEANIEYQGDYKLKVGKNYNVNVGNNYAMTVDNSSVTTIKKDSSYIIDGSRISTIGGNESLTLTGNLLQNVTGGYTLVSNGTASTTFNSGYTNNVKGNRQERVTEGNYIYNGTGDLSITTNGNAMFKVVNDFNKNVIANETDIIGGKFTLDVKKDGTVSIANGLITQITGNNNFTNNGNTTNTHNGDVITTINGLVETTINHNEIQTITGNRIIGVSGNQSYNIEGNMQLHVKEVSDEIFSNDRTVTVTGDQMHIIESNNIINIKKSENKEVVGKVITNINDTYDLQVDKEASMIFNEGLDILSNSKLYVILDEKNRFTFEPNYVRFRSETGDFINEFRNDIILRSTDGDVNIIAQKNNVDIIGSRGVSIVAHNNDNSSGGDIILDTGGKGSVDITIGGRQITINGNNSGTCTIICTSQNGISRLEVNSDFKADKVWNAVYN